MICFCVLVSCFKTVLMILRLRTKHVQFWFGVQFPLYGKTLCQTMKYLKGHDNCDEVIVGGVQD